MTSSLQQLSISTSPNPHLQSATFSEEMLQFLIDKGFSKDFIAQRIGASVATINRALRGRERNFSNRIFSNLLGLYCAVCHTVGKE